jgi:hypothetical protein
MSAEIYVKDPKNGLTHITNIQDFIKCSDDLVNQNILTYNDVMQFFCNSNLLTLENFEIYMRKHYETFKDICAPQYGTFIAKNERYFLSQLFQKYIPKEYLHIVVKIEREK